MLHNFSFKKIVSTILVVVVLAVLGLTTLAPMARAIPVEETFSVPQERSWWSDIISYARNKVATIFFQNILRKVLNDFAFDAAKYVAAGGKGQEALYVKEKWGNFWKNVGDAAAGDFIESLANSVIADIAANDAYSEQNTVCNRQYDECKAKGGSEADCSAALKNCLAVANPYDEASQENTCIKQREECDAKCQEVPGPVVDTACFNSCRSIFDACYTNVGASRKKPMLQNGGASPLAKINICNPRLQPMIQISLGLVQQSYTGYKPTCKFSEMTKNWDNEANRIADMASPDFLRNMASMWEPGGSDLSVALTLQSNLLEYRGQKVIDERAELTANKGWLNLRNFAGDLVGTPGDAETRKKLVEQGLWENLGTVTGDILVDAANIFLNQLAISAWQNLMGNLTAETQSGNLSYWSGTRAGRQAIDNRLNKISEPIFNEPGRLDVLSELSACAKPEKPGPTDCVITSQFADAVTNKMTVRQAVESGRLPADWPLGFDKNGEDKISYNQGYPYRSLLILRKYRILPVGWEVAAQKIQKKYLDSADAFTNRPNGVTLGDLLICYSEKDDLKGDFDNEEWCKSLVDPYWVLKLPDYYCNRRGYGPDLIKDYDLIPTGRRFCSADEGQTRTKVDDKEKACLTNNDCCSEAELATRDKKIAQGDAKGARALECAAACNYEEKELKVYRDQSYCADEQGCIREGAKGKCLTYGYCTEESRSWLFNKNNEDKSCEPVYNTCQAFRSSAGKRVAFLANTLNYACQANSIGCKEYSVNGAWQAVGDKVVWNRDQSFYFNKKLGECRAQEEGCREFIRVADNNGTNLIADGSLEAADAGRWGNFGAVVSAAADSNIKVYQGGYSLHIKPSDPGVFYSPANKSLLPAGFAFEADRYYTLSARVYVVSGKVRMAISGAADSDDQAVYSSGSGAWEEFVLTIDNDFTINADRWSIKAAAAGTEFYLDTLKFEIGDYQGYAPYRGNNLVYQKLLPAYLESACYQKVGSDYSLKEDAPAKCQNYSRKCNADEAGCEAYTEVATKETTAAQVKPKDYCPEECVGYDVFVQKENNFYSARDEYFIPKTAKTCRAQAAGCSLFVNLDKLKEGGEANEYFSKFRRCVIDNASCAEFYTWEGSDESGYQLVVYQLQENKAAVISQPATIDDDNPNDTSDGDKCNEVVYGLPASHPSYNPDCRQFYGRDGNVSYHIYFDTVSCAQNCHPYRLVENNVDVSITSQTACAAANGVWQADSSQCVVCLHGGVWQAEHQACVYLADVDKSVRCNAAEAGCGEYEGNFSNNLRFIFNDTFEGDLGGWINGEISSDSLNVGGHSLKINSRVGRVGKDVSGQIRAGKRYVLSFIAKKKSANARISDITLKDKETTSGYTALTFSDGVELTVDWQPYKFDLYVASEALLDKADILWINSNSGQQDIRLDNIKLTETEDNYYFIRNSWTTPESCNQDLQGNPAPLAMLGCKQYRDSANKIHNLKSFSKLCQLSAVGCQPMIDTQNSSFYGEQSFAGGVKVASDNLAYIVYNKKNDCAASAKGCSRLGLYQPYEEVHKDVYRLVNPDLYQDILCTADQVGCEAWATDNGEVYFKDPGSRLCDWRQGRGGSQFGWYQANLNHCVSATECSEDKDCGLGQYCTTVSYVSGQKYCVSKSLCQKASDCAAGAECKTVENNNECDTSEHKTIGLGNVSVKIQPIGMAEDKVNGKAGLCPLDQDTCTEYVDPESRINYNLIARAAGSLKVKPYTLYIVKAQAGKTANISCANNIYKIDKDNNLLNINSTSFGTGVGSSEEFYVVGTAPVSCSYSNTTAEIKEALVNYRLKKSINKDQPETVDLKLGQVLFNERSFTGGKYNKLIWSTNATEEGKAPQKAASGENNANALLKVDPDRQCVSWLGCKSYIDNPLKPGEKICYERGLCKQMDKTGECIEFADQTAVNQTFPVPVDNIANLTGYSKVGYDANRWNADLYQLAAMKQEGEVKVKFDGSFENVWQTDFASLKDPQVKAAVVNDARVLEKELGFGGYKDIPDGQAVGKTDSFVAANVKNVSGRYYIVSAYVYLRFGDRAELTIGNAVGGSSCPLDAPACASGQNYAVIGSTTTTGRWVRLAGKLSISNSYRDSDGDRASNLAVGINVINGLAYFDDVRLEPGLNIKTNQYLHSDCRIYPEQSSMSCDYFDRNGLRKKGWAGYCLEYDPRNAAVCLLWYPLDKVESEEFEEGVALTIAKDLYYCIDAEDQCNAESKTEPEFYCKKFIKVDKDRYWYGRVNKDSTFVMPAGVLNSATSSFWADFGVNAGGKVEPITISQQSGSGFYGAYMSRYSSLDAIKDKATVGVVGSGQGKKIMPFVPYYGWSNAGDSSKSLADRVRNYFCMATVNREGDDQPVELSDCNDCNNGWLSRDLGVYDNCYVGIATVWNGGTEDSCMANDNRTCGTWTSSNRSCSTSHCGWIDYYAKGDFKNYQEATLGCPCYPPCVPGKTKCSVEEKENKKFVGMAVDDCNNGTGDGDEAGCFFDCFNHTNFYRAAQTPFSDLLPSAASAVKRLFIPRSPDTSKNTDYYEYYVWSGNSYVKETGVSLSRPRQCADNIRPPFSPSNVDADYCTVFPEVGRVWLSEELLNDTKTEYVLNGSGWVALRFTSKVDKEQLPLKRYRIAWDYNENGQPVTTTRGVNMYDRPSENSPHLVYFFVDAGTACGSAASCTIQPTVTIYDNWDSFGFKELDKPLRIIK